MRHSAFFAGAALLTAGCFCSPYAQSQSTPSSQAVVEARTLYNVDPDVLKNNPQAEALSVDVFWCTGDKFAVEREVTAAEIGGSLATFARLRNPALGVSDKPDTLVKTVRLRPLDPQDSWWDAARPADNVLIVSDKNNEISSFVQGMSEFTGFHFSVQPTERAANYIRFVACPNIKLGNAAPRITLKVSQPEQQAFAREVGRSTAASHNGVYLDSNVQVLGTDALPQSEVKYFDPTDASFAKSLAAEFAKKAGSDADVKFVPGQETGKGIGGLVELDVGSATKLPELKEFLLCEGEIAQKCPSGSEHIDCYGSTEEWAKSKGCGSYSQTRVTSASGNKCGYSISRVTCNVSRPN